MRESHSVRRRKAWATGLAVLMLWSALWVAGLEVLDPGGGIMHRSAPWLVWAGVAAMIATATGLAARRT